MNKLRLNENKTEVLFITTRSLTEHQSTELDKLNLGNVCRFLLIKLLEILVFILILN